MEPAPEGRGRAWWQTLPGMITAIAGLITAVTGLVLVVHQIWPSGSESGAPPAATLESSTGTTEGERGGRQIREAVFPAGRRVVIDDLRYDILGATASPGNPGELALTVRVRLTNMRGYDANFWNQTFRLRAGADTSAPTNFVNDLVAGGATGKADFVFTLPASTRRATLLVGDDPAKAVGLPLRLG
jgi:hypothetical protein